MFNRACEKFVTAEQLWRKYLTFWMIKKKQKTKEAIMFYKIYNLQCFP